MTVETQKSEATRFIKNILFGALLLVTVFILTRPSGGPNTGQAAPALQGPMLSGEAFDIETRRGQVVVLDFWATWCPPCLRSLPALQKVHAHYKDNPTVLIASVNIDSTPDYAARVGAFMKSRKFDFPVIFDPGKRISNRYKIKTVPTMVIIDTKGHVSSVHTGLYSSSTDRLIEHIEQGIEQAK